MVMIKNIVLDNGIVTATCYKENDINQAFTLKLDASGFSIIENSLEYVDFYCRMAINKMRQEYEETGSLPDESFSYWV